VSDAPLSVAEITERISAVLEADPLLAACSVRGEISNFKRPSSGHLYFSLKDAKASLPCVMWRSGARSLQFDPEDGMEVVARGRVGVYAPHGRYQLYVDGMSPVGAGDLWAQFEALKRRLEAEGLFDHGRKRPLPSYPRGVAVVSSSSGAATQDMLTILARRYPPAEVTLVPATVQGDAAPASLIAALEAAAELPGVDVVLIGRGGGSMEDLWCFNNEALVRAVAACPVPVVSAVGHETDFTLTDFAADLRAPTPSAAAELAVPDRVELLVRLDGVGARLQNSLRGIAERARLSLERLESRVPFARPQDLFAAQAQRVDEVSEALDRAMEARLETAEHRLERLGARLDDLGPTQTLARGYAIARGPDGQVLRQAKQVEVGSGLEVILADGALDASVTRVRAEGTKPGE
jgi:exodeoxyribonuclease VII large subunit